MKRSSVELTITKIIKSNAMICSYEFIFSENLSQWEKLHMYNLLTLCGLMIPYGDIDMGQHWSRQWLVAWWHQVIRRTKIESLLMRFFDIHPRAISQWVLYDEFKNFTFKITATTPKDQRVKFMYHVSFQPGLCIGQIIITHQWVSAIKM